MKMVYTPVALDSVSSADSFAKICDYALWSAFEADVAAVRRLDDMGAMGPGEVKKAIVAIRRGYGLEAKGDQDNA